MSAISLALATGLFVSACGEKEVPESQPEPQTEVFEAAMPPFSPPSDGLLTRDQIANFLLAHEAMGQVTEKYLDDLGRAEAGAEAAGAEAAGAETAGAEKAKQVRESLDIAQDMVCRKFGLNGYAEYAWILSEAGKNPVNRDLLAESKVTLAP